MGPIRIHTIYYIQMRTERVFVMLVLCECIIYLYISYPVAIRQVLVFEYIRQSNAFLNVRYE